MHIGVDFDNTIVRYDDLFYRCAEEYFLIDPGVKPEKFSVRDSIRSLEDGETKWQKLQAVVYCYRMKDAELMDGVGEFFQYCRARNIRLTIVSHKTETAAQDKNANLRKAAFVWMSDHGFFKKQGFGFTENDIFFESTRDLKIARISELGCTHFIDDMIEVLSYKSFPEHVRKILLSKEESVSGGNGLLRFGSWNEINEYLFDSVE